MAVRTIDVRERVMARNDLLAAEVRCRLEHAGVLAFNLVSSPGSGKTLLLERTLEALGEELDIAVVTGDVQTQNDADRLARHTTRLVQAVVTGGACHLDASQITEALNRIELARTRLLLIENVGNLVCPAGWDLGEMAKIVVFSVTEGEDKPLKYPTIFNSSDIAVVSKVDLVAAVEFDWSAATTNIHAVRPGMPILGVSARSGEGMDVFCDLLEARLAELRTPAALPGS